MEKSDHDSKCKCVPCKAKKRADKLEKANQKLASIDIAAMMNRIHEKANQIHKIEPSSIKDAKIIKALEKLDVSTNKILELIGMQGFDQKKPIETLNCDTKTLRGDGTRKREKKEKFVKESSEDKESRIQSLADLISQKKIKNIYLDGNNMLFVDDIIRKRCLKKQTKVGEAMLAKVVFQYCVASLIPNSLLVFDNTKQVYSKESEGVLLKVQSAYPEFESSDSAFKVWAGGMNAEELKAVLFVTSDRELNQRLKEKGVQNIMKSGEFMKSAKILLGEAYTKCLEV